MQTETHKFTENHSITGKNHSNALILLRRQRLRLDSYTELANVNANHSHLAPPKRHKALQSAQYTAKALFYRISYCLLILLQYVLP